MRWPSAPRHGVSLVIAGLLVAGGATLVATRAGAGQHIAVPAPAHTFDVASIDPSLSVNPVRTIVPAPSLDGPDPTASAAPSSARPAKPASKAPPTPTNRLVIPSLRINATLLDESIVDNSLTIPDDVDDVGHYRGGAPLVGAAGTVLLAGHVNERGQGNGALFELSRIAADAVVQTVTAAGATSTWHVTSVQEVNKAALPQDIFTASGPRRLVVVTCGGALEPIPGDPGAFSYQDNVIVTAVPA